jgi:hypothetical protein
MWAQICGELPPAACSHPLHERPVRQPARSAARNLAALLAAALNETVTVSEDGKRRPVTNREAVIVQLVNKSASADLRATKMLIDILRDIEKKADPSIARPRRADQDRMVVFGLRRSGPVSSDWQGCEAADAPGIDGAHRFSSPYMSLPSFCRPLTLCCPPIRTAG